MPIHLPNIIRLPIHGKGVSFQLPRGNVPPLQLNGWPLGDDSPSGETLESGSPKEYPLGGPPFNPPYGRPTLNPRMFMPPLCPLVVI